eukprot:3101715-Prorocentrum_lima.AAC.1
MAERREKSEFSKEHCMWKIKRIFWGYVTPSVGANNVNPEDKYVWCMWDQPCQPRTRRQNLQPA